MANFGKPNTKGRSSGRRTDKKSRFLRPPKGGGWTWLTSELMESDAWLHRSRQCRIFIDALLIDHISHAGQMNGHLVATYDQLEAMGAHRPSLRQTIGEACFLGFVRVTKHGGRWAMTNAPSRYQLTFYGTIEDGVFCPATNDWKGRTEAQIERWHKRRIEKERTAAKRKKQKASYPQITTVDTLRLLPGGKSTVD